MNYFDAINRFLEKKIEALKKQLERKNLQTLAFNIFRMNYLSQPIAGLLLLTRQPFQDELRHYQQQLEADDFQIPQQC